MAYGYVELGKGTRLDVVPGDNDKQHKEQRGPAEIVGGAVGGAVGRVADTIGQKIHRLFSDCL